MLLESAALVDVQVVDIAKAADVSLTVKVSVPLSNANDAGKIILRKPAELAIAPLELVVTVNV